ncbi:hypothetical protein HDE_03071 [Halotydeus destructor]|nr:hypothetical protein HDE_03071 [Halotydeus destructor]
MDCPVCTVDISTLPFDTQTGHVNFCLDEKETFEQIAIRLKDQQNADCPICLKKSQCNLNHIKSCAKSRSIGPKKLLQLLEDGGIHSQFFAQFNKVTDKDLIKKVKKPAKPRAPRKKKPKLEVDHESESPVKIEAARKSKPVTENPKRSLKQLTLTPLHEYSREKFSHKLKALCSSIIQNHSYFPSDLPHHWFLAELKDENNQENFIARGFEKFIDSSVSRFSHTSPCKLKADVIQSVVNHESIFLKKLSESFNDENSADLKLELASGEILFTHRLIWRLHVTNPTYINESTILKMKNFSYNAVHLFTNYCYTGRLVVDDIDTHRELYELSNELGCAILRQELTNLR